jgi:hypothetical protein
MRGNILSGYLQCPYPPSGDSESFLSHAFLIWHTSLITSYRLRWAARSARCFIVINHLKRKSHEEVAYIYDMIWTLAPSAMQG